MGTKIIYVAISLTVFVIFLIPAMFIFSSERPETIIVVPLTNAELNLISILIDQLDVLDGEFVCDYGFFTDEIKCLGLQSNVEIFSDSYKLTEGTRSGALFDNDGTMAKLKGEHPEGFTHDSSSFTYKEIGTKYYLITQEPTGI